WSQTLVRLRLPASVPYLVPALKLAATARVIGAIVGEVSAAVPGGIRRGIMASARQCMADPARLYRAVITGGVVGVMFVGLVGLLDIVFMRNRPKENT